MEEEPVYLDIWPGFLNQHPDVSEMILRCWRLDPTDLPNGFTNRTTVGAMANGVPPKYQYDLRGIALGRPLAWRVPFLLDPNYGDPNFTVSHLCHNEWCMKWEHHVLEPLNVNKGRMGCPGGAHCHHTIRCIRPGPTYDY